MYSKIGVICACICGLWSCATTRKYKPTTMHRPSDSIVHRNGISLIAPRSGDTTNYVKIVIEACFFRVAVEGRGSCTLQPPSACYTRVPPVRLVRNQPSMTPNMAAESASRRSDAQFTCSRSAASGKAGCGGGSQALSLEVIISGASYGLRM